MARSKYGKYIVTELKLTESIQKKIDAGIKTIFNAPNTSQVLYLDSAMMEGAMFFSCCWYWPGYDNDPGGGEAHVHEYDEIFGMVGTNPDDVHDLGGELEYWIENEKFIIKKSFIAHIPRGTKHSPVILRNVRRPIFRFYVIAPDAKDRHLLIAGDPGAAERAKAKR
jgi:hypothetical protein